MDKVGAEKADPVARSADRPSGLSILDGLPDHSVPLGW
jgi:hypothetical protein